MKLADIFNWWTRMLRDLLPRSWRDAVAPTTLLVRPIGKVAAFTLERRGRAIALGDAKMRREALRRIFAGAGRLDRVLLELDETEVLERDVVLPLAAERDPGRVLGYEMDRLTPFSADELVWTWRPLRRDPAQARLTLALAYVPRAQIAERLAALAAAGVAPTGLRWRSADRMPQEIAFGRARRSDWVLRVSLAVCAGLAVTATVLPPLRVALARAAVERRIAALQPRLHEAEALRARLQGAASGGDALSAERARNANPLATLATLTRLLPDGTFLTDLSLSQRQLAFEGQARSAAALIGLLSQDPRLRDPAFTAAVTPNGRGAAELFAIRAMVAQ